MRSHVSAQFGSEGNCRELVLSRSRMAAPACGHLHSAGRIISTPLSWSSANHLRQERAFLRIRLDQREPGSAGTYIFSANRGIQRRCQRRPADHRAIRRLSLQEGFRRSAFARFLREMSIEVSEIRRFQRRSSCMTANLLAEEIAASSNGQASQDFADRIAILPIDGFAGMILAMRRAASSSDPGSNRR